MFFLKPAKPAIAALAGFGILVGFYIVYALVRLAFAGSSAADLGNTLQQLKGIDSSKPAFTKIDSSLSRAIDDLSTIRSATNDPILAPLAQLPWIGRDFAAVKTLSIPALDIASSLKPCTLELAKLEANPGESTKEQIGQIASIALKHFDSITARVVAASTTISSIKASGLHFGLSEKVVSLQNSLGTAKSQVTALKPYLSVVSQVLNAKKPNNWFIATQNLAEARGTGGILGSYAVIRSAEGKVSLLQTGSDADLLASGPVNPKALPADLQSLWNADPSDWRDLNTSIHVPYFAKQIVQNFKSRLPINGVLFLGQGVVSNLVGALGSVTYRGDTIDADHTVTFLTKTVYERNPSVASSVKRRDWVSGFMKVVFSKLAEGNANASSFLSALSQNQTNDRLMAWSTDPKVEKSFDRDGVSGAINPHFGSTSYFSFNNSGGNKLDAYLRARASYSLGKCGEFTDDGYFGRKALLSLEVASDAPKSNLPWYVNPPLYTPAGQKYVMGANRTLVSVYGPVGSTIRSATLDGQDVGNTQGIDNGHTVWVFYVPTKPGQKRLLKVEWAEPIVDDNGKNIQTPPVLISPVALNRIGAKSSSPGFCPIPAN